MYDGTDDEKRPDTSERYAGAISTGSTRVGNDSTLHTSGDIVAAAGMGRYRLGQALLRLVSEWHSGALPRTAAVPEVKELARKAAAERVEDDIRSDYSQHGLTISEKNARRAATTVTKADMELAAAEERRLAAMATDWALEEAQLRFQRMKSLPAVRAALLHWAREKEWEDAEHLVAKVLQRFLSPKCPACHGSGKNIVPGTMGREVVKRCVECRKREKLSGGRAVLGEVSIPHGGRGKRMLDYLEVCTHSAAADLRQGLRMRRAGGNVQDRARITAQQDVERLARVDREAEADGKQDTEAVAEHFRRSMGGKGGKR